MKISLSVFSNSFLNKSNTLIEKILIDKNITPTNIKSVYTKLHKFGLNGIELGLHNNFTSTDIETLRSFFQKTKIPILSIHQPIRLFSLAEIKEIEEIFKAANRLDAKLVVLHSDMAGKQLFSSRYVNSMKRLEKRYKIIAAFENMQKHYVINPNSHYFNPEKFQKIMQRNNFSITLDTTHMGQVKGDIISFFQQNKHLIKNIHISDFQSHFFSSISIFAKYKFHMSLGKGELPIKKFLQTLKNEKYTGNITMEIPRSFDELVHSIKIIKKYIS